MTPAVLSGAARRLLTFVGGVNGTFMAGDLEEEYFDRRLLTSKRHAVLWYCWQVAFSLAPLLAARLRRTNAAAALGGIALGYAVLIVWAVSAAAVISAIAPGGIPRQSAVAIQIGFVAWEAAGTVLAGAAIGFIALRRTRKIVASPAVIALIILILAPAVYFALAHPDALPPLIRLLRILSVAPSVMLGAQFGRRARRWIERRRDAACG